MSDNTQRRDGPQAVLDDALRVLSAYAERPSTAAALDEWLDLVGLCQQVLNRVTAAQDAAIARVAAIEVVDDEDGTLGERHHLLGDVQLDSADLVAPRLGLGHPAATRRVTAAVALASAIPVVPEESAEVEPTGEASGSGLAGLRVAMREGRLDGYRAGVLREELELAPPQVAAAVIAGIDAKLASEPAALLRRRVRRMLARISPDLLRQRAERARSDCGLRRWVEDPGVDTWMGRFPTEEALGAWAAIDELAFRYVTDGVCTTIERARGRALTDLVTANATVTFQIGLTTPADRPDGGLARPGCSPAPDGDGDRSDKPADDAPATGGPKDPGRPRTSADDAGPMQDSAPAATLVACREDRPTARSSADLIEVTVGGRSEPTLVPRAWLDKLIDAGGTTAIGATQAHRPPAGRDRIEGKKSRKGVQKVVAAAPSTTSLTSTVRDLPCAIATGALVDAAESMTGSGYRPGKALIALVKARDGRCRFPGCSIAARFCDLDHVRPWPTGPTAADNLICLCRRHHRIKQRPGWRVAVAPDGRVTWRGPTGTIQVTEPIDRLTLVVLPGPPDPVASAPDIAAPRTRARRTRCWDEKIRRRRRTQWADESGFSPLQFVLEHRIGRHYLPNEARPACRVQVVDPRVHGQEIFIETGPGWRAAASESKPDSDLPPF